MFDKLASRMELRGWLTSETAFRIGAGRSTEVLGFLSPFGDITLWNILASCIVSPYISPYACVTNLMLWGYILPVVPETLLMEGGDRFHRDTSHDRPDPLVT